MSEKKARSWDAGRVRALRRHLGLSQDAMADELGTRQQTVSEWETGQYQPRGASAKLLGIIAERAAFEYEAVSRAEEGRGRVEGSPADTMPPLPVESPLAEPQLADRSADEDRAAEE
ncbi:MAG: helix-turn-helix domain-containing protein [Burkholderiales bacterium]